MGSPAMQARSWASLPQRRVLLALSLLGVAACQAVPPPPTPPVATEPPPPVSEPQLYRQEGRASWYGDAHHGRKTAGGDRFDKNALTAAHRTLPLGSRVRVTNLENGRTVEV